MLSEYEELARWIPATDVDESTTELDIWRMFLVRTDHIPNKIIEAQILARPYKDYTDILELRQHARDRINELSD